MQEEAARESQMHLVSIQEETTAVGQYRMELMGSYQNLIYFFEHHVCELSISRDSYRAMNQKKQRYISG